MILGSFRSTLGSLGAQLGGLWLAADALIVPETLEAIHVTLASSHGINAAFASSESIGVDWDNRV